MLTIDNVFNLFTWHLNKQIIIKTKWLYSKEICDPKLSKF